MRPLTVILLAVLAAAVGAAVGLSAERGLRRGGGESVTVSSDSDLQRLRWVAAAVAMTLAVKAAVSAEPALVLAWVPVALVGPWVVAAHQVGVRSPDRLLAITTFFTVNGVVVAIAFTGRVVMVFTAGLGFLLAVGLGLLARRLSAGAVTPEDVQIAGLVGLACGSLGLPLVGLAGLWALGAVVVTVALGRFRVNLVGSALLAGAWVAAAVGL